MSLHDVIDDVKSKLQQQKKAAVLGAVGVVAAGLTVVGTLLCHNIFCAALSPKESPCKHVLCLQGLELQQTWSRQGHACLAIVR